MGEAAVEARVTGRVQGVAFRAWTKQEAEAAGLRGWVMNAPDRSVHVLLAGPAEAVAGMVRALEDGPPAAVVARVETREADADEVQEAGDGFHIRA